jgi:AcrR family transcriptional regulator
LIHTTQQLVLEKGCRSTTLQDIIDRSGISKGGIYHYVSGKDELLGLVLKESFEETNRQFEEAVNAALQKHASVRPFEILSKRMAGKDVHGRVVNEIYLYLVSQMDKPKVQKILSDLYQFRHRLSVQWIQFGQQSGAIPQFVNVHQAAMILEVLRDGLRIQHAITEPPQHVQPDFVLQMLMNLLTDHSGMNLENKASKAGD